MTERPTEQTHPRLTGLDSPTPASSVQSNAQPNAQSKAQAPILPPMPSAPADRVEHRPQTSSSPDRPSLADRLQEKLSSIREAERPAERLNGQDQTAVRPGAEASTAAPEAPPAPAYERPMLPPPAANQPPQPAHRPAKNRPARASRPKRPPRRALLRLTRIDPWSVM